ESGDRARLQLQCRLRPASDADDPARGRFIGRAVVSVPPIWLVRDVDGCLNPRLSGAGSKIGGATANPAPSLLPKPFIPGHRTDGGQQGLDSSPLSGPSAAEGGGRRPAFTVVCRPATIDAE